MSANETEITSAESGSTCYDDSHYFHIFPDPQFLKKGGTHFTSDILGKPYAAVQPTAEGMKWLAEYYFKKHQLVILTNYNPKFKDKTNGWYDTTGISGRYDFILDSILQLRQSKDTLKVGFVIYSGSHACMVIYEKINEKEWIYQFDSLGTDGPFDSIVYAIHTKKYDHAFNGAQIIINTDSIQTDITTCTLFSFYMVKDLLRREILPLLRNIELKERRITVQDQLLTRQYYECHLPIHCLKIAQNKRLVTEDLLQYNVKGEETLASYRKRYSVTMSLTSSTGEVFQDVEVNKRIFDYGLKLRKRAQLFFSLPDQKSAEEPPVPRLCPM